MFENEIKNIDDIPKVAKDIFDHFLEGDSIEQLAEEYKVDGDCIEKIIRETSKKAGADMVVEVLLNG